MAELIRAEIENRFRHKGISGDERPRSRMIYLRSGVIYRRSMSVGGRRTHDPTIGARSPTPGGHSDSFEPGSDVISDSDAWRRRDRAIAIRS